MALGLGAMAQQVCVVLNNAEREELVAIAADRNRPRKHVERARIVLASADRHAARRVAQSIGVSRPTVWRWHLPRDRRSAGRHQCLSCRTQRQPQTFRLDAISPSYSG